jgi:DNA invertase Pin-like site-specific DNA recombinase
MKPKTKVVALLRVSSEAQAQADREGLPAQHRVCQRIAVAHDLEIVEEVRLEGVSGAAVLADPNFAALLRRLESPEIGGVVVADFDRLFRRGRFADYAILDAFADNDAVLFTSDGVIDPSDDMGAMNSVFRGEMSGQERRRLAERTRRGREEKRRRGLRAEGPVGIPRGVNFDLKSGRWSYVFPEAERVREAFRLFLSGMTNMAEIRRRTGLGTEKDPTAIQRVLRQPLYMGIYRVDRKWRGGKAAPREPHEAHEHVVIDPPLIPRDDFDRAQQLLAGMKARRVPVSDPETRPGIYGGFLACGLCGASVHVQLDSRGYGSYCCGNQRERRCKTGHVSVRLADPQLDATVERMLGSSDTLRRLIEASAEEASKRAQAPPAETSRRVSELRNQERRVKDAYVEGAFGLPELKKRVAGIQGEINVLTDLMEREAPDVTVGASLVAALVDVFSSWQDLTKVEKRELLRSYRMRVVVIRPRRGEMKVERVEIGALPSFPDELCLYKKMKRHGIT